MKNKIRSFADVHSSRFEIELISKIADRALALCRTHGLDYSKTTAVMDIELAHNLEPLDLNRLLAADDGTFGHDALGIRRHLDRTNLTMTGCFLPRCSLCHHTTLAS